MTQPHGIATPGASWAMLLALAACSGDEPLPTSTERSVATVTVSPAQAEATALGETRVFTATARDALGEPVFGAGVSWTSSPSAVATVDGSGSATAKGNGRATIRATIRGVTGSATLDVEQEAHELSRAGGDEQQGPVAGVLPEPLRVRVLDSRANPIAGVPVSWKVIEGGGSVVGTATDPTGTATAVWTLGPTAGTGTVRASAGDVEVTFTATALLNGAIRGVVTEQVATYLSPPRLAGAVGRQAASPAAGAAILGAADPPRPSAVPGELLVRLREDRIGMADAGSPALRGRARAEQAAGLMRRAAARWDVGEPIEVAGASPVVATLRVRVPPGREDAVAERLLRRPEVASVEPNRLVWATGRPVGGRLVDRPAAAHPGTEASAAVRLRSPHLGANAAGSAAANAGAAATGSAAAPGATRSPAPRPGAAHAPASATGEPYFTRQAWHYDLIDAFRAWEVTTGSTEVIVAVVDDGIRFDHPDVAPNLRSDGYDFVTLQSLDACTSGTFSTTMDGDGPDPDPTMPASLIYDPDFDCVVGPEATGNHGLHVAGTIGARAANGSGGVGVAWEVGIRPVRALGSAGFGTWYDIAQGILYAAGLPADDGAGGSVQAAEPADVINLSLGGSAPAAVLEDAVEAATMAGSLLIAAAGNGGSSVPQYPAAYPDVLAVSSITPSVVRAPYSSFGSNVDIAAPGGATQLGADHGVWSLVWSFQDGQPGYEAWQGTSMATPHVSGVAALVLAASPGLGPAELRARLVDHAVDVGAPGRDDFYGAGVVDANASVRNGAGVARDTYVWAIDVQGARHGPVRAEGDGSYEIAGLEDGEYRVYAGQDRNGDALTGFFGRLWGAFGGSTTPTPVLVTAASTEAASFGLGLPRESEDNDALETADPLPLGGYTYGFVDTDDVDLYRVDLAEPALLVVETEALIGACGLVAQVDTFVRLLDHQGIELAKSDDVDASLLMHCSRVETSLGAGTYYVEVTGSGGDMGHYAVRVGEGA